jgi:hypothetical protein
MPIEKMRKPLTEMMYECTVRVWNMVSMKTVTKSFLKTGITNALDESEDMLWVGDKNIDVEGASELVPESSYENNCDQ